MNAYRCSKCGQFRDASTPATKVEWWVDGCNVFEDTTLIELCPECADVIVPPLEAISKTETGE